MSRFFLYISLVFLLFGCRKEYPTPDGSKTCVYDEIVCGPIFFENDQLQWMYGISEYQKLKPHFNPNNCNQFLFVDKNLATGLESLCTYDLVSGEMNVIVPENVFSHQPQWHENDWIIYRADWGNVFRIKSNGDSIQQLSTEGIFQTPEWSPDGQHWVSNLVSYFPGHIRVYDLNGNVVDTIEGHDYTIGDWSKDNRIVTVMYSPDSEVFGWTNVDDVNWEVVELDPTTHNLTIKDIHWVPGQNKVVLSQAFQHLSVVDLNTNETTIIKEGCIAMYYKYFSICPDCSKIIAERVYVSNTDSDGWWNYVIHSSQIVIMNLDGSCETVIPL